MRILFDHGTPAPLRLFLTRHTVREAKAEVWEKLGNGELLSAAESAGFELLITTDKNIRYQLNLFGRKIAIVVLGNPQWPVLRQHVALVVTAVDAAAPGSYLEIEIPDQPVP